MKVLLTQLPNPEFMVIKRFGNTPLAAGYLKAMADQADLLDRVTIEIMDHDLMNLGTDQQIIRQTVAKAPDILGFTLYLWNIERSLRLIGLQSKLPMFPSVPEATQHVGTR